MNLANFITSIRLVLVPFIVLALVYGRDWLAFAFLAVALISDLIDGFVARKMNQITDLGQVLDPLADKSLFLALFGYFAWVGRIPIIAFFLLLLPYFALMLGGGVMYQYEGKVVKANVWGKTSSAVLALGLIFVYFRLPFSLYLIYLGIAGSFLSALVYFRIGIRNQTSRTERGG
ncbi:CDP-alcohol phosphatidyltransferase family protein [Candidatus Bipolaricaulota bacterium]|nr:CDP-alcohol phosphatidyltransferase family protein [Candidatus Bipolaricaulota bacterium]